MSEDTMITAAAMPAAKPFPGIWAALGWVGLFMLVQVIVTLLLILPNADMSLGLAGFTQQMQNPKLTALPTIRSLVVSNLLLIGLFVLYVRKGDRKALLGLNHWGKHDTKSTIRIAAILIVTALAFNIAWTVLIGSKLEMQKALRDILAAIPPTGLNVATILFATVILAPIVEELVFRGMLQKSLARRLPIWASIGLAAIIFAAMHGDINSAPALCVIGGIFGLLYHLTGSLRVTILAHLANNLFAMLAFNFA
jgi:membrane protease YdiL (CAAX protease family)